MKARGDSAHPDAVIAPGSRVTLNFRLRLADGTVVDESAPGAPLTAVIGGGALVPGLEHPLLGLKAGELGHFELASLPDFGDAATGRVERLARAEFPPAMELEPGSVIVLETPAGEEVLGLIVELSDSEVTVDFSHPLAGHALVFEVEILAVEPPAPKPE